MTPCLCRPHGAYNKKRAGMVVRRTPQQDELKLSILTKLVPPPRGEVNSALLKLGIHGRECRHRLVAKWHPCKRVVVGPCRVVNSSLVA